MIELKKQLICVCVLSDFEVGVRQYTSSKRGNSQVQKMHAVEGLLQELIRHQEAWPFCKPVDKKLVRVSVL